MIFPPTEQVFEKLGYGVFPADSLDYVRSFTNAVIEDRLKKKVLLTVAIFVLIVATCNFTYRESIGLTYYS